MTTDDLRALLARIDSEPVDVDFGLPLPSVHDVPLCECVNPCPLMYSEQVGLWLCDCSKFIVDVGTDEVSK